GDAGAELCGGGVGGGVRGAGASPPPAVIALAGVALGVLVGELRALRLQDRRARVVLRSDQLEMIFLPEVLRAEGLPDLRVDTSEGLRAGEHGGKRGRKAVILPPSLRRVGRAVPRSSPRPFPSHA